MNAWMKTHREGFAAWTLESSRLSVTIVPELGSKIVSLRNKETGREWLWSSGKPLGNQGYASSFGDGDESGWDEMFPGINACSYPNGPWRGAAVPDHGEVWTLPWDAAAQDGSLRCSVEGRQFPYRLEKVISLASENTLRIDYEVTNDSDAPFSFLWAAHPLLRAEAGMKLRVPDGLKTIAVAYSAEGRLGEFGATRTWPRPDRQGASPHAGGSVDLSVVEPNGGRYAEKYYFADELAEGWAEVCVPDTDEAIAFRFPPEQVPYLAVWANYGGYGGHYHLAIEPATGMLDDLAYAMREGKAATVAPRGKYRWHMEVAVR
ncbi:hypothetical protein RB620_19750 [Paenibacillus sp. LHD-117]|uniref:aldose epimerase family protein n=1 Tax=Paenibacillus sp. LHD-117 TaxID=3071412 RepID=UPI0027DF70A0|nr:hypothetical protein [Paenibacillus sp. LHD-117]MDQ6421664.1 hypothetical protein [Paenibacillus sp. LHD-117]